MRIAEGRFSTSEERFSTAPGPVRHLMRDGHWLVNELERPAIPLPSAPTAWRRRGPSMYWTPPDNPRPREAAQANGGKASRTPEPCLHCGRLIPKNAMGSHRRDCLKAYAKGEPCRRV